MHVAALLVAALLAGCDVPVAGGAPADGGGTDGGDAGSAPACPYLTPLTLGNQTQFHYSDSQNATRDVTSTLQSMGDYQGRAAWRWLITGDGTQGPFMNDWWESEDASCVLSAFDVNAGSWSVEVDGPPMIGHSFTVSTTYSNTTITWTYTWRASDPVTVPAGSFTDCFVLASINDRKDNQLEDTYCRGVGVVQSVRLTPFTAKSVLVSKSW